MRSFRNDAEVLEVVHRFEACEFGLSEFDHAHHLTVGMAYLWESDVELAMGRMRTALRQFSGHHGKMGYHETLTRFWLLRLDEVRHQIPGSSLWEACNAALGSLWGKDLVYQYYERERLMSDEARQRWVEPQKTPDSCLQS